MRYSIGILLFLSIVSRCPDAFCGQGVQHTVLIGGLGQQIRALAAVAARGGDTPSDSSNRSQAFKISGWTLTGVGVAGLVASIVTGSMALSKDEEVGENCPGDRCPAQYRSDIETRDDLALTTDVLIAVGSAMAVTGIVLLALSPRRSRSKKKIRLRGVAGPSALSASISWGF